MLEHVARFVRDCAGLRSVRTRVNPVGRAARSVVEGLEGRRLLSCGGGGGGLEQMQGPAPMFEDNMGYSMATQGDLIVVGASGRTVEVGGLPQRMVGEAYVISAADRSVVTLANPDPDPAEYDGFGKSVAIAGNQVAVGAPFDNAWDGTVYIYTLSQSTGAWQAQLTNTLYGSDYGNRAESGLFGWTIAGYSDEVSGDQFLITALQGSADGDGRVILAGADAVPAGSYPAFENPNEYHYIDWQGLEADATDNFGSGLAIRKTETGQVQVLIGSRQGGEYELAAAGEAFLFDGSGGAALKQYANPLGRGYDLFGESVGFWGNNVVIGAPGGGPMDEANTNTGGNVHVMNAETGELVRTISDPTPLGAWPMYAEGFGRALVIEGGRIVVAAPGATATFTWYTEFDPVTGEPIAGSEQPMDVSVGAVYSYDLASGAALETFENPTLPNYGGIFDNLYVYGQNDAFGSAIGLVNGELVSSDPYDDTTAVDAGSIYIFRTGGGGVNDAPTATLGSGGVAEEGSAVTVSFSNQADTCAEDAAAGFRYSFALDPAGLAVSYAAATDGASKDFGGFVGTRTVYARIFDRADAFSEYTIEITINNVGPAVAPIAGPAAGVRGFEVAFGSSFSDPGQGSEQYTVTWDFGDGLTASGSVSATHVYASAGTYAVGLTVGDGTDSTVVTTTITISGANVVDGRLLVGGTGGVDDIDVLPAGGGRVYVLFNGVSAGIFGPMSKVMVQGGAGNDDIKIRAGLGVAAEVSGGEGNDLIRTFKAGDVLSGDAGNDTLSGHDGSDILLGGEGDDLLVGGKGRDLLIGGFGADRIVGRQEDDILIAGTTAHDGDRAALDAILAEWNGSAGYSARVSSLRAGYLADDKLFDDQSSDILTGDQGLDLFVFNSEVDRATDLTAREFEVDLGLITEVEGL